MQPSINLHEYKYLSCHFSYLLFLYLDDINLICDTKRRFALTATLSNRMVVNGANYLILSPVVGRTDLMRTYMNMLVAC